MTKYRVLRKPLPVVVVGSTSPTSPSTSANAASRETWEFVVEVEASSHDGAIRKAVEALESGGEFVAVPARSFKTVSVAVEQKLAVTLS